jgi:hypothetical protein
MTGWNEDFLQSAVDQCTNLSGLIEDCAIFDIQSEDDQRQCHIEQLPSILQVENVLGGIADVLTALPGDVAIQYGPESATLGAATATSDVVVSTPSTYSAPALTYAPGSSTLGGVFYQDTTSTAAADGAATIQDVPKASTSSASSPATTPAPTSASDAGVQYEVVSTSYITNGAVVQEIVYEEAIVYVTEDVVTTVTVSPSGKSENKRERRNHLMQHRHHAGRR